MPLIPHSKRRISPYSAPLRPLTVAMPSPTVRTVPASSTDGTGSKLPMVSRIRGITSPWEWMASVILSLSWRPLPSRLQSKTSQAAPLRGSVPSSMRKPSRTWRSSFHTTRKGFCRVFSR